jgi:two-component system, OmpR family, KDP operon response regulator KdpE
MARVLLIDGDVQVRGCARRVLEEAGHAVDEAADGAGGVAASLGRAPDVVVCDLGGPGVGEVDAVEEVRRLNPRVGVVAVSDGRGVGPWMAARLLGAGRLLHKPFGAGELCAAVEGALAGHGHSLPASPAAG